MSEYWISQGRKMCSYCKCWIADNKASINFHEQGKNHKENVKKRLDELRKKGLAEAKRKDKELSDMEKIERAALESLKQDLSSNPNMADAYGIPESKIDAVKTAISSKIASMPQSSSRPSTSKQPKKPVKKAPKGKGPYHSKSQSTNQDQQVTNQATDQTADSDPSYSTVHYQGDWYTAVNEEGYTYYWNTVTNETSWYPPDAPETSGEVSTQKTDNTTEITGEPAVSSTDLEDTSESQQPLAYKKNYAPPDNATASGEPVIIPEVKKSIVSRKRVSAYGAWEVIKEEQLPELQLPTDSTNFEVSADDIPMPDYEHPSQSADDQANSREKKFKEKEVSLGSSSNVPVAFKKRKFGANRQNRRQASDDL